MWAKNQLMAGCLFVVEGESDSWTLWYHRFAAIGIPGAGSVRKIEQEHIDGVETIYFVVEQKNGQPDDGGKQFLVKIPARLAELGFTGKVYELRMPDGIKDPSALHIDNPDRFKERFEQCVEAAKPIVLPPPKSIMRKPIALAVAPYTPPPLAVLPDVLRKFVKEAGAAIGCDPAYVLAPLVSRRRTPPSATRDASGSNAAGSNRRYLEPDCRRVGYSQIASASTRRFVPSKTHKEGSAKITRPPGRNGRRRRTPIRRQRGRNRFVSGSSRVT